MTNVFIIHGTYGYPEENWIPWLKAELERLDCNVIVPQFPTPNNMTLDNWLTVLDQYKDKITADTIYIGHSAGASFIPSAIEHFDQPIKAAFLVAGFVSQLDKESPMIQLLVSTFVNKHFDWLKIGSLCPHFEIFQSDDDPYVPFDKAGELARHLRTEVTIIKKAGHFNEAAGYTRFPLLLDRVRQLL
jgi:hypothetical protein